MHKSASIWLLSLCLMLGGCGGSGKASQEDAASQVDLDAGLELLSLDLFDTEPQVDIPKVDAGPDSGPCPEDGNPCTLATLATGCEAVPVPGCCRQDEDCDDGRVATEDLCRCPVEEAGCALQCQHLRIAGACDQDGDCQDDNRCNLHTCLDHVCVHEPDLSLVGCCESDLDCDDGSACTDEYCDLDTALCQRSLVSDAGDLCQQCCLSDPQCDDGDPLTLDSCQDNCCLNEPDLSSDCKTSPGLCDDQNPCTQDSCDQDSNHCLHASTPGCCKSDLECQMVPLTDRNSVTTDLCDLETNRCLFIPVPSDCLGPADCVDGDPCTWDRCVIGACVHLPVPGCCQTHDTCDDDNPCTVDNCLRSKPNDPAGSCQHPLLLKPGCCDSAAHCDDGDGATKDLCLDFQCLNQ